MADLLPEEYCPKCGHRLGRVYYLLRDDVETLRAIADELADGVLSDGFHGPATTGVNRVAKEQSDKLRAILAKLSAE